MYVLLCEAYLLLSEKFFLSANTFYFYESALRKTSLHIFSWLCFFAYFTSKAQNENTKWYFGNHVGLDFMTNPPSIINNSAIYAGEGCSSIADAAGNTLFYTNGLTVWDKQNNVMANGTGLLGDLSSTQSALIIKMPYSANLYYIFTACAWGAVAGINYSIVDMNLAAGMGSVTIKNAPLFNSHSTEQLTAVKHANGVDFWIMTHELVTNNFRAYLFSAAGINTVAVISSVGTSHGQYVGSMKFSPSGQKLASVLMNHLVELYDFSNSNGIVSNPLRLAGGGYGCEFSPDGSKFYCSEWDGNNDHNTTIKQWDLSNLLQPITIPISSTSSYTAIAPNYILTTDIGFRALQLAPDSKIYVARRLSQSIGVINNPDAAGATCSFVPWGQAVSAVTPISSAYSIFGLPNMKISAPAPCQYSFMVQSGNLLCGVGMSNPSITVLGTTGNVSYLWTNGATTYSTAQVSTLSIGNWTVSVTDDSGCTTSNLLTVPQSLNYPYAYIAGLNPLIANITNTNITSCPGGIVTLKANGAGTYLWSNGAQGQSITVTPTVSTQYFVTSTDQYGCVASSNVVTINIDPVPTISINCIPDVCVGDTKTLTLNTPPIFCSWSTANSGYYINGTTIITTPTITTTYVATATYGFSSFGQWCSTQASITVHTPSIGVTASKLNICPNEEVILTATGGMTYTWSTLQTEASITVTPAISGVYVVFGEDADGCGKTASQVIISVSPCTSIDELQNENSDFKIYPNPVEEMLNVEWKMTNENPLEIFVYDVLGNVVIHNSTFLIHTSAQLNVSGLKSGIYFVRTGNEVRGFVKE